VSSTAKVERTFHYGPYGENVKSEGTQTIPFIFGYKGGYRMPGGNKGETTVANGLYHYGQRYYDPTTGRWTQQDPLERAMSPMQGDRFGFAGADPINISDPRGTEFFEDLGELVQPAVEGIEESWKEVGGCVSGGAYGAYEGAVLLHPEVGFAVGCAAGAGLVYAAETNPFP
jgi:RHS repeat-associated protein